MTGRSRRFLRRSNLGISSTLAAKVLERHAGLSHYTIGQRKGIGVAAPEPLYVVKQRCRQNVLVVRPAQRLGVREVCAGDVNLISMAELDTPMRVTAKTHYRQRAQAAEDLWRRATSWWFASMRRLLSSGGGQSAGALRWRRRCRQRHDRGQRISLITVLRWLTWERFSRKGWASSGPSCLVRGNVAWPARKKGPTPHRAGVSPFADMGYCVRYLRCGRSERLRWP